MIRIRIVLLACVLGVSTAFGGDFEGKYQDEYETGATLTLTSSDDGEYDGTLLVDGADVPVTAEVEGNILVGELDDGMMVFEFRAYLDDDTLVMNLMAPEFPGEVLDTITFARAGSAGAAPAPPTMTGDVVINGRALSERQVAEIEQTYGVKPLPGKYWYDGISGLYGVVGYQAYGYMLPGHDFGDMDPRVSNGDTNVFVNGRELPQSEWLIWSYMLGAPIQMGAYWLDAQGNAGYVGNPMPTVNLFAAAMQNAYRGQGGSGGDNFWSSRFSAGNSNANNTQGYVSVPGHGPVGYGF